MNREEGCVSEAEGVTPYPSDESLMSPLRYRGVAGRHGK